MRLIDADAMIKDLHSINPIYGYDIIRMEFIVNAQPTIDAVEVVRCKECRYYEWMSNRVPDEQTWFCHNWDTETGKADYCSYGERRESNE